MYHFIPKYSIYFIYKQNNGTINNDTIFCMDIHEQLKSIGLHESEIKVYLFCCPTGFQHLQMFHVEQKLPVHTVMVF